MNGSRSRQKPSGPSAASMNGRRRPSGVWKVSLHGPITGESESANTPSAPSTSPISVPDSVKRCSSGGRYAAVVVIENASPNAPRPSVQKMLRRTAGERRAASAVSCATKLDAGCLAIGAETAADDLDHRLLRLRDLLVAVFQLSEHPTGQDLLERAVEDVADHARVDVGTKLSLLLTAADDPLEPGEGGVDLVDLLLEVRAAGHLAHEHAHEIGIAPPCAQQELRDAGEAVTGALVGLLDRANRIED